MVGVEVGAHVRERGKEFGGIGGPEGDMQSVLNRARFGREVSERGDLSSQTTQVGGVGAGPGDSGALGGPGLAGGRHALLTGGAGGTGAASQVSAFGGLAAGDAERVGEVGPAGTRVAGGFDQAGLPSGELLAHLPKQKQGGQRLLRSRTGRIGEVPGLLVGIA